MILPRSHEIHPISIFVTTCTKTLGAISICQSYKYYLLKWESPSLYSAVIHSPQLQVSDQISQDTSTLLQKEVAALKRVSKLCYII